MVILILGIAMAALAPSFGNITGTAANAADLQQAAQMVQRCGELIMGTRRRGTDGYTSIGSSSCNGLTISVSGVSTAPTVTMTDPYTGAGCPSGATCKTAAISFRNLASTTVMLVSY